METLQLKLKKTYLNYRIIRIIIKSTNSSPNKLQKLNKVINNF